MKNFFVQTLLLISVVAASCFCSLAQTAETEKFNPDGGIFYLSSDTKAPRALANFEGMAIGTHDYKANGQVVPIKPTGVLYEKGNRRLKMTKIVYDGENFSFETVVRAGVSYQFSGEIPAQPKNNQADQIIILKGHLIKFVNGKKAAEADLKFIFEEGS